VRNKILIALCSSISLVFLVVIFIYIHNVNLAKVSGHFFGEPVWVFKPQQRIVTSLLDDNSHLFIQTLDSIYSLDIHTGEILWQTGFRADPVYGTQMKVSGDILLVQGEHATVAAYSANSGKLLWQNRFTVYGWIVDMAVNENNLYVARHSTYLTAYNLSNGNILWSQEVPDRNSLFVFAEKDKVYLGTSDLVRIYETQEVIPGKLLQEHNLNGLVASMKKVENTLYVAYYKNENISFSALDINTFENRWSIQFVQLPNVSSINSMIVENETLYATGDRVAAIALQDGKVLWISDKEISFKASAVSRDAIYALDETYLYAFDKSTGDEMERIPLPGISPLTSLVQVKHSNLFISAELVVIVSNGQVYCYPRSMLSTSK
jgi:outer membrane protein assembly factor BamB